MTPYQAQPRLIASRGPKRSAKGPPTSALTTFTAAKADHSKARPHIGAPLPCTFSNRNRSLALPRVNKAMGIKAGKIGLGGSQSSAGPLGPGAGPSSRTHTSTAKKGQSARHDGPQQDFTDVSDA